MAREWAREEHEAEENGQRRLGCPSPSTKKVRMLRINFTGAIMVFINSLSRPRLNSDQEVTKLVNTF